MASPAPISVRAVFGVIAGALIVLLAIGADDPCSSGCGVVTAPLFDWLRSTFGPGITRIVLSVVGICIAVLSWRSLWPQEREATHPEGKNAI